MRKEKMYSRILFSYPEIQKPSDSEKGYGCIYSRIENLDCTGMENDIMDCVDSTWVYNSCRYPSTGVNCRKFVCTLYIFYVCNGTVIV